MTQGILVTGERRFEGLPALGAGYEAVRVTPGERAMHVLLRRRVEAGGRPGDAEAPPA